METLLGLCVGVGLAAACGFRVFVPLLVLSVGAKTGLVSVGEGFEWIASWPAVAALAGASVLEVGAYLSPWLDHALDAVAGPAAVVAGTLAAGSQVADLGPMLGWAAALIAGGGAAAAVKAGSIATRGTSTVATAGLANPFISAGESAASLVVAVLSVVLPVLSLVLLGLLVIAGFKARADLRRRRRARLLPVRDAQTIPACSAPISPSPAG